MMNKLNNVFGYATRTLARTGLVSVLALTLLAPPLTVAQANTVTLNFVNADIGEVARAVAVMTGRNLVVDPRVRGNINMVSERPVSTSEAYDQFLTAVRLQGYTVVETAGIYKLVPEADAKQQANTLIGTAKGSDFRSATQIRGNQIATQVFPLAYENANTMVGVLRPLMGPNSNINVNPSNNSLIITDYADNLQRVAKLIASQDVAKGTDLEIVPLQSANANDLAPLIIKLSESSGSGGTNAPMILADTRSNSIILRAGNPSQMMQLKDLIQKLDREFQGGAASTDAVTPGVYVIKLKNGEATKIATTLRSVLPQGIAAISQPGTTATSNVQIQADAATNSLIITAPDSQYRQLKAVIEKLDARPAQVFIESLIAEVNSDKVTDFGIQWQSALGQKGDGTVGILGSAFGSGTSNITGLSLANKQQLAEVSPQGLNFGLFKKEGGIYVLGMLARLLESTGDGNILATPNVLTLDNEESRVIVGQNVPFVTGQYTSTGNNSVTNPFQTIERKDVGLTLRVKPQISENGAIRLKIYQESSSVDSTSNEGLITNKRSIETNVIVDDGAIVVLGGLLDDRSVDTESKVPVLGDIATLLLNPVFTGGLLLGLRAVERGEALRFDYLFEGFKQKFAPLLGVGALTFGVLILFMIIIGGLLVGMNLDAIQEGGFDPTKMLNGLSVGLLAVSVIIGILVMMLFWFTTQLITLNDVPVFESLSRSFQGCLRNPLSLLVYVLVVMVIMLALMLPPGLLFFAQVATEGSMVLLVVAALVLFAELLLLAPWLFGTMYVSYKAIFLK